MGTIKLELHIAADTSSAAIYHPHVIQSFSQLVREILDAMSDDIDQVSIFNFANTPVTRYLNIPPSSFKEDAIYTGNGGLCNVHLALMEILRHIMSHKVNLNVILLLLSSATTDTSQLLSEEQKGFLSSTHKYLIKTSHSIKCPEGFVGCTEYLLQDEEESRRLISDLSHLVKEKVESTVVHNATHQVTNIADAIISFSNHSDSELQPPEFYQYD